MITEAGGKLDAQGRIINWDYGVWSNTHNTRPGPAGNLLAAQHLAEPFTPATPRPAPQPAGLATATPSRSTPSLMPR
ncbi:hypothetical protein ACFQU7_30010 [Pseudoroseomonas wenyumeiae]